MSALGDLVCSATAEMERALGGSTSDDWTVQAGDVSWTCLDTGAHVADDLFSYASQVLAQPGLGYLPIEAKLEDRATPEALLQCVVMCGHLLRLAVKDTPTTARAWHPNGTADPDGFAAMGILEVLVHTYDIAQGLGLSWEPPPDLCGPVLARLFPEAPDGHPTEVLLWCAGRSSLGDRARLTEWRWDSSVPSVGDRTHRGNSSAPGA
jgi:hypothetical protein